MTSRAFAAALRRSCSLWACLGLGACVSSAAPESSRRAPVLAQEDEACSDATRCEAGLRCLDDRCSARCAELAVLCAPAPCGTVDDACSLERVDCAAEGACERLGQGDACALDGSGCCTADCSAARCGEARCDRLCLEDCAEPEVLLAEPLDAELLDRPSRRSHPAFAGDGRGNALLFGGYVSSIDAATGTTRERFFDDTWLFSLSDRRWRRVEASCPAQQPSPRRGASLVWWPPAASWLLLGGEQVDAGPVPEGWLGDQHRALGTNEAWLFDGTCWTRFEPPEPWPDPYVFASAAWDPAREELVLLSGWTSDATWILTADRRWELRPTPLAPSERTKAAFAWDGQGLLLFGGMH